MPCAMRIGRERMERGEGGYSGGPLVDLGVVLHGARAERIEARVDRVVELREVDEVADDLGLVQLGQADRLGAAVLGGQSVERVRRRMGHLGRRATRRARARPGWAGDRHRLPGAARDRASSACAGCCCCGSSTAVMARPRAGPRRAGRCPRPWSPPSRTRAGRRPAPRRPDTSRPAAGQQTMPRSTSAACTRAASGHAHGELIEIRATVDAADARSRERVLELLGTRRAKRGHVVQPVRPERRDVDRGGQRAQRLVGADVAGGLVAPDVLLARAQGHDVRAPAVDVRGAAHEPAGHLAHEVRPSRQEAEVRTAVLERDAQRLALADGDVRAVFTGRGQNGERDRLDDGDEQRAGGVRQTGCLGPWARGCRRRWAGP